LQVANIIAALKCKGFD